MNEESGTDDNAKVLAAIGRLTELVAHRFDDLDRRLDILCRQFEAIGEVLRELKIDTSDMRIELRSVEDGISELKAQIPEVITLIQSDPPDFDTDEFMPGWEWNGVKH